MAESGLTNLSRAPFCSETILGSLGSQITPTESFYIRSHFSDVPELDPDTWRLQIEGLVSNPITLSLDDLRHMPSSELVITLECAGNSRSYVNPPAEGFPSGTARWARPDGRVYHSRPCWKRQASSSQPERSCSKAPTLVKKRKRGRPSISPTAAVFPCKRLYTKTHSWPTR